MKYNTKIQRRKIYQKLLKIYQIDLKVPFWGIYCCSGICSNLISIRYNCGCPYLTDLPELYKQRPRRMYQNSNYWWTKEHKIGILKRINALEKAIELTY